jgi:hypothetical protein
MNTIGFAVEANVGKEVTFDDEFVDGERGYGRFDLVTHLVMSERFIVEMVVGRKIFNRMVMSVTRAVNADEFIVRFTNPTDCYWRTIIRRVDFVFVA